MTRVPGLFIAVIIAAAGCDDTPTTGLGDSGPRRDATPSVADAAMPVADAASSADATTSRPDATTIADASAGSDATTIADASSTRDASAPDAAAPDAQPVNDDASVSADAGPANVRGICRSSADCFGAPCVPVPNDPAGWHTCAAPQQESVGCSGAGLDQCCTSADCAGSSGGGCFAGPLFYCGGARPPEGNVCTYDECASDADCTGGDRTNPVGVCVPRGAFGEHRSVCAYGDCRFDADCAAGQGGECRPFQSPCNGRFVGFHCTYATSACREDTDCPNNPRGYCAPGLGGMTSCEQFIPPP